jgi:hypothetical protein
MVAALWWGSFVRFSAPPADAEAVGSVAIGCEFLASRIDGDLGDATTGADLAASCDGLTEAELDLIDEVLGDGDESVEEGDFAGIDLDGNQIQDGGTNPFYISTIYVIAFLDDDEVVTFDADAGLTVVVSSGGNEIGANDADAETCDAGDDLDCDNSTPSSDDGDGVAVATVTDGTADAGETVDVDVSQADDAGAEFSQTINVVAVPDVRTSPGATSTPTPTATPSFTDTDEDEIQDDFDACPLLDEDWDGYVDFDGCPDLDNDLDGVFDVSDGCPNVAESFDAFKDSDGCPDPDNDNDGFPDTIDDCPGTDYTAGPDGIADSGDEPLAPLPTLTKEDYDGVIDTDGCHDSPGPEGGQG